MPKLTYKDFIRYRRKMKISRKALAELMGVSEHTIRAWEKEHNGIPDPEQIERINSVMQHMINTKGRRINLN